MAGFNESEWNFPKSVSTPDIEEDIEKYLSNDILIKFRSCDEKETRKKVIRVTEMLEFIDHLNSISSHLVSLDKPTYSVVGDRIYKDSHIEFASHDFSGFNYDCEALILYLLLSLIDTCVGQEKYVDCADFISDKLDDNCNKKDVIELLNQHKEQFGLSKNFKKAFTEYISDNLKNEICSSLFYFSSKKESDGLEQIEEWHSKWQNKTEMEKLKKIAEKLYEIRSKYTHCNIRSFIPDKDYVLPDTDNNGSFTCKIDIGNQSGFLCKKKESLVKILKSVILELTEALLDGRIPIIYRP